MISVDVAIVGAGVTFAITVMIQNELIKDTLPTIIDLKESVGLAPLASYINLE